MKIGIDMVYVDILESTNKPDSYFYYKSSTKYGNEFPTKLIESGETVLTQNRKVFEMCESKGYPVNYLHLYLGFQRPIGLYEIFSFFFDGRVDTDFNMIQAIFNGLIIPSDYCFCLKLGNSFCWFTIKPNSIQVLGYMQLCHAVSKYSIGKFMKLLRYEIVMKGYNLDRVKWLIWDESDINNEFSNYIVRYDTLSSFFSRIEGFEGLTCKEVMRLLSNSGKEHIEPRANVFVDCLRDSFQSLGIYEKDGVLYSNLTYYKDFSSLVPVTVDTTKAEWGVIIDCEGKRGTDGSLSNGFRELGGIIYCKVGNFLYNMDTFVCDELMFESTIEKVMENYKELTGSPIKDITCLVYGGSDRIMFYSSLENVCSKPVRIKVKKRLVFKDCRSFIREQLGVSDVPPLDSVAKSFGVACIKPSHSPLNDCRTLFNVLAKVLLETGVFIETNKQEVIQNE